MVSLYGLKESYIIIALRKGAVLDPELRSCDLIAFNLNVLWLYLMQFNNH